MILYFFGLIALMSCVSVSFVALPNVVEVLHGCDQPKHSFLSDLRIPEKGSMQWEGVWEGSEFRSQFLNPVGDSFGTLNFAQNRWETTGEFLLPLQVQNISAKTFLDFVCGRMFWSGNIHDVNGDDWQSTYDLGHFAKLRSRITKDSQEQRYIAGGQLLTGLFSKISAEFHWEAEWLEKRLRPKKFVWLQDQQIQFEVHFKEFDE